MIILKNPVIWFKGIRFRGGIQVNVICPICQNRFDFQIPPEFVEKGEEFSATCRGTHPKGETFSVKAYVLPGKGRPSKRVKIFTEVFPVVSYDSVS